MLYATALALSAPVWVPWAVARGAHKGGWRKRFGRGASLGTPPAPRVLVHGVSVGEVNSVSGLVPALEAAGMQVVVSATTDTGMARARSLYETEERSVVRFPFDWSGAMARFLDRIRPDIVALVELEVWPNLMEACASRGIPVVVVGGRMSDASAPRYRRLRPLFGPGFGSLSAVGAQTELYAQRFRDMGIPADRVVVTDSLKWDAASDTTDVPGASELAEALGIDRGSPLVVAGSTGPGEEAFLLRHWPDDVQLVVAPRKPERFDEGASLDPAMVRRTDPKPQSTGSARSVFLLDTLGELNQAYALADVALVGRSLFAGSGSDPIQPAALGCATVIGPHFANFRDQVEALLAGGGIEVLEADQVVARCRELAQNPIVRAPLAEGGRAVVARRRGATDRTVELITRVLAGPS